VPPAERPNGTLGKHKRRVRVSGPLIVFTDDGVNDAALIISPLNARRPLASAAEAKPFFSGTPLARYLNESIIDHDPVFRKRDRAICQDDPNQIRTRFAPPTRAKNRRF